MGTKVAKAFIGFGRKAYQKIIDLGVKVKAGIYANVLLYPTPTVIELDFSNQLGKAQSAQGKVKRGSEQDTTLRDTETGLLFDMLDDKLLLYTNGLWKGNRQNLEKSGFPVSDVANPVSIPDAPTIKRVDQGKAPHSLKILLGPLTNPLDKRRQKFIFDVWVSDLDGEGEDYKIALTTTNSRKLILLNCVRGKEVCIKVSARNSAGQSELSSVVKRYAN